jgi:hypothetical protein
MVSHIDTFQNPLQIDLSNIILLYLKFQNKCHEWKNAYLWKQNN